MNIFIASSYIWSSTNGFVQWAHKIISDSTFWHISSIISFGVLEVSSQNSSVLFTTSAPALLEYSKDKAKLTFAFRFLAQAVLPTGFTPRYFVEDKDGKIWGSQILAKEYQNLLEKHNENHVEAFKACYRTYGYEHSWLTTSKTLSKEGKQSFTDRGIAFEKENKMYVDK